MTTERHIPVPTAPTGTRPAHVLVVDDQSAVREFLHEVLRQAGYRPTVTGDGEQAVEIARQDPPQVVLTDLSMAPVGGLELIGRMRRAAPAAVPVVLTGYGTVEKAVELMRAGAFSVLTKPCSVGEITATVAKALEHHAALSANQDLRERLRVQDKLAMIGKLAAGVAHELNNPLDATLRCMRMLKDRVSSDAEAREMLELAHAGLLRMADIVQSLLTFSRNAAVEQTPQPLVTLVEESITAVSLALDARAPTFLRRIGADVERLPLPRGIYQVLTNLLRNAADATGAKGTVTLEARRVDDRLHLSVTDDGPGIPAHVLPRVFEPFFTTKEPGRGTGLGLPISARLVEKFGGAIRLECPPGGGTVATVNIPAQLPAERSMQEVL
jgi:signal transduction histidine kinase